MKNWVVMMVMLLLLGSFATMANAGAVRAGESISTDKSTYVMGEIMTITIHGENRTWYNIRVDSHWIDTIQTNATGYYQGHYQVSASNFLGAGTHVVQLEYNGHVVASRNIVVRQGLQLWPSEYTHSVFTYLSGETMWVWLSGENNKTYIVNITNATGHAVYTNTGVHTNDTGVVIFSIPLNIGDDDYSINLYNGSNFIQSKHFTVRSVEIVAGVDKGYGGVYLLSEKIHAYVSIYWMKSHALLGDASYKWWIVDASNHSASFGPYAGHGTDFTTEKLSFYTMGNNPNVHIELNKEYMLRIQYENTNSTGRHFDEAYVHFYTGSLGASINLNALDGSISPGKRAQIELHTYATDGIRQSAMGNVHIDYLNITITKYWQTQWGVNYTNMSYTDASGYAYLLWNIPSVPTGSEIKIISGVSYNGEHYRVERTFWIYSDIHLNLEMNKNFYLAGESMGVDFHASAPSGINVLGFDVWIYSPNKLFHYETTTSEHLDYNLPVNYSGPMYVKVVAHFSNGDYLQMTETTHVYYGYIYLSASQDYYFEAGDEITIYSDFSSEVMHPTALLYKVMDDSGNIVMRMNASLNQFTFTVPNADSKQYTIMAEAMDGSYYAENTLVIQKFEGYFLSTNIVTKSKYQSMVYEPGQTIKISYNITKYGDFEPHVIVLHWDIVNTNYHWEKVITPGEFSGVISLKIPGNLKGGYAVEVWVSDSESTPSTWNLLTINVEKGSWSMQDIAGMPMLSFINLILVIVAIVIGIFAILPRLHRKEKTPEIPKKGSRKKGAPKPYSPEGETEPAEEAGKAPPSAESEMEQTTEQEELGEI